LGYGHVVPRLTTSAPTPQTGASRSGDAPKALREQS
jgi:hypothetical protein